MSDSPAVSEKAQAKKTPVLLISEPFFSVLPSLARAFGIERGIILQHMHFLLQMPKSGKMIDGAKWIWNTYDEWKDEFRGIWAKKTIADHIRILEDRGALITMRRQEPGNMVVKYYRLNYELLNKIAAEDADQRPDFVPPHPVDGTTDIPNTVRSIEHPENGTSIKEQYSLQNISLYNNGKEKKGTSAPAPSVLDEVDFTSNRARLASAITGVDELQCQASPKVALQFVSACRQLGSKNTYGRSAREIDETCQDFLRWWWNEGYDKAPALTGLAKHWRAFCERHELAYGR